MTPYFGASIPNLGFSTPITGFLGVLDAYIRCRFKVIWGVTKPGTLVMGVTTPFEKHQKKVL